MIATATGRVEGADLAQIDHFNAAVKAKAARLGDLLRQKHGPGDVTHSVEQDHTGGGVIVLVTWRANS